MVSKPLCRECGVGWGEPIENYQLEDVPKTTFQCRLCGHIWEVVD